MIQFTATPEERKTIESIATRAVDMGLMPSRTLLDWEMDVSATHANGTPLHLDRLLAADDFNFAHDLIGIARHLDRNEDSPTAGKLTRHFLPRFAARQGA